MMSPYSVVKTAILSEKIARMTEQNNQYCFKVDPSANKVAIKKAVEQLFNVQVLKVNTQNRRGKLKRERTMKYGRTSASKRALVTLKKGDTIDMTS